MLEVKKVSLAVGKRQLVSDLSFVAADSQVFGVVGDTGTGKTLLLRSLMGLFPLAEGHVSIDGEMLTTASAQEFRHHLISYMPQEAVAEADTMGALATTLFSLGANKGKPLPKTLLTDEWKQLGLTADTFSRCPAEMTVSERHRAVLAIVCMQNKPIVLADDALASHDPAHAALVGGYLHNRARRGQTVIVTGSAECVSLLRPDSQIKLGV